MLATFVNFDGANVIDYCNLKVHCKYNYCRHRLFKTH